MRTTSAPDVRRCTASGTRSATSVPMVARDSGCCGRSDVFTVRLYLPGGQCHIDGDVHMQPLINAGTCTLFAGR